MNKEHLYILALTRYGLNAQIDMVFEEMSELQKELCKYKRGRPNTTAIAEEIADVEIMLSQMKQFFGIETEVQACRNFKLMRLEERLTEGVEDEKTE